MSASDLKYGKSTVSSNKSALGGPSRRETGAAGVEVERNLIPRLLAA